MNIIEGSSQVKNELMRLIEIRQESIGAWSGQKEVSIDADRVKSVKEIVAAVREGGDKSVRQYTKDFDGVELGSFEVGKNQVSDAYEKLKQEKPDLVKALEKAAERIDIFHAAQKKAIWGEVNLPGLNQLIRPLKRVGVYVPGGTAIYASTVLMTAVPAKVAGVEEVILVTPPQKDGKISPLVLAAAYIAKVDRIFAVGGAQAIAALAYGTDSIPKVDKICGPGNIFVMLAKREVYGAVAIDGLQGPSEVVIIADETANPRFCASDLLAQAEHDLLASAVLITTSRKLAEEVNQEV
ncbi:histidinol dehydrogenase, partial [Chloroflexota bacterium]